MCGLLIIKYLRNVFDESVVEQWSENASFQYFCDMQEFTPSFPCNTSELVHFRKRIEEKGIELILAESIRVNDEIDDKDHHDPAFIDSTVQEKKFRGCYQCDVSRSSIQLQKGHEASFVPNKQNQRNTLGGENFAEIYFLRLILYLPPLLSH